jgi:hypothetical protein
MNLISAKNCLSTGFTWLDILLEGGFSEESKNLVMVENEILALQFAERFIKKNKNEGKACFFFFSREQSDIELIKISSLGIAFATAGLKSLSQLFYQAYQNRFLEKTGNIIYQNAIYLCHFFEWTEAEAELLLSIMPPKSTLIATCLINPNLSFNPDTQISLHEKNGRLSKIRIYKIKGIKMPIPIEWYLDSRN